MGRADAAFSDYWVLRTPCARPRAWDHLSRMSKPSSGSREGLSCFHSSGGQHLGQQGNVPAPSTRVPPARSPKRGLILSLF